MSHPRKISLLTWEAAQYKAVSTSESDEGNLSHQDEPNTQRPTGFRRTTPFFLHFFLICTYSAAYFLSGRHGRVVDWLGIPYEQKAFEVSPLFNKSTARIYAGEPGEELETAWHKLLQNANIRVPEEKIKRLDRLEQSVRFTDGSGYFAQMTVYHHLHCIKRLHKSLHVEHYWPNATSEELFFLRAHNSHCLDTLRQAIMCQGDTSLITFKWGTRQPVPLGNFSSPHTCRSWEALDAWNEERHVDVFQPGLVVHPKLGPAYGIPSEREGTGVVIE